MPLVRGTSLVHIRSFIREHHGAPAVDRLARSLDPMHSDAFAHAHASQWYPAAALDAALCALDRSFARGDLASLPAVGEYVWARDLASPLGWLFRLFAPTPIVAHADVVWRRFHTTGRLRCTTTPRSIRLSLDDWNGGTRASCQLLRGYLTALARELAPSGATVRHERCAFRGARACEFDIDCSIDELSPLALEITHEDITPIGRELGQITSHAAVRDAIVAIFRSQTDGCDAALSLADDHGTLRSIVSTATRPPPGAHHWVLEARGRIVGKISVAYGRNDPRGHTVGELVPWMAMALASSERAPDDVAAAMNDRVRQAVDHWDLTPRQEEILRLVIEGRSNRQIALALDRAEGTIEIHVKTLLKKASVSGRTELTARVASMPTRR